MPEDGSEFPPYAGGQYIALRRDNCRLTKKAIGPDGRIQYVPDIDEAGRQKRGPVSHSYSISSAPYETQLHRYLEFYVILHMDDKGLPGRLTDSLFRMESTGDTMIGYFYKITGDFTLEKRAAGFQNVVMVGTGSGLAPFASMIKQLHHEATQGKMSDVRYTLFHGNRGYRELGYNDELTLIEKSRKLDFIYVPTVSRPSKLDYEHLGLGKGRANNLLRLVFDMRLREEKEFERLSVQELDTTRAKASLAKTVRPVLPHHISQQELRQRMNPRTTVVLTCGNPDGMADIKIIAEAQGMQFEMEEW